MIHISRSAKLYQERRQRDFQPTMRGPGPQVYLQDNLVHKLKLEPPALKPACDQGPDAAKTQAWPHGDYYVQ